MNITLILASVLLNSAAQILIRKGMLAAGAAAAGGLAGRISGMLSCPWLWAAMLCYAASVLLWMAVLSKVEVSFAYPFLSLGYVAAAAAGFFLLGESLPPVRVAGIAIICLGVCLVSRS